MDDFDAFMDALTVLFRGRVGDGLIRVFMMVQLPITITLCTYKKLFQADLSGAHGAALVLLFSLFSLFFLF
jgi:hypothetical protein